MTTVRLIAASLVIALSLGTARASDPEQTGSIGVSPTAAAEPAGAIGGSAAVTLPEQSVTTDELKPKPLPPLKPLPKWDPHVCIGC